MEGHSAGLCLTMAAHAHALLHGAVLLEEAETQTDPETTTWNDASTHIINLATQAVISLYSKSKHYNPAEPEADLTGVEHDKIGLV